MKAICHILVAFALFAGASPEARAQSFSNVPLAGPIALTPTTPQLTDLVALSRPDNAGGGIGTLLPLSAFASSDEFRALNAQISKMNTQLSEGIAMASAVTIVPPNPGDRFSLNFSGADFNSQTAGSVAAAYRVSDQAMLYAGYARGSSQNLGKVGISFSFH